MHLDEYSEYGWRHMTRINVCYSICTHEYHWTISTKACSLKCYSGHPIGQQIKMRRWYKFRFFIAQKIYRSGQKTSLLLFACGLTGQSGRAMSRLWAGWTPLNSGRGNRLYGILHLKYYLKFWSKCSYFEKICERNFENLVNKKGRKGAGKVLN